jgi:hypothetical protein
MVPGDGKQKRGKEFHAGQLGSCLPYFQKYILDDVFCQRGNLDKLEDIGI